MHNHMKEVIHQEENRMTVCSELTAKEIEIVDSIFSTVNMMQYSNFAQQLKWIDILKRMKNNNESIDIFNNLQSFAKHIGNLTSYYQKGSYDIVADKGVDRTMHCLLLISSNNPVLTLEIMGLILNTFDNLKNKNAILMKHLHVIRLLTDIYNNYLQCLDNTGNLKKRKQDSSDIETIFEIMSLERITYLVNDIDEYYRIRNTYWDESYNRISYYQYSISNVDQMTDCLVRENMNKLKRFLSQSYFLSHFIKYVT